MVKCEYIAALEKKSLSLMQVVCLLYAIHSVFGEYGGTRWLRQLRHCVPSREVAGYISDGVTWTFH